MRFEGTSGSRVDVEAAVAGMVVVSVTQVAATREGVHVALAALDANHAEALAAGILAACKEQHARAVSP